MTLTPEQDRIRRALAIGAPAIAELYQGICERPGRPLKAYCPVRTGGDSSRVVQLERARLIRTERAGSARLCFPLEAP